MSKSLSVILPVYNVETKLAASVRDLLDVVTDLTGNFEIVIVDDGSTDNTEEVSMELGREFPQITVVRQSQQLGEMGAARAGIARSSGEILLIHDLKSPLSGDAIRQLWEMRNDTELVFARSEQAHPQRVPAMAAGWSGTQMLRREAVGELQETQHNTGTKIDRVMRTDVGKEVSNPASILRQLTTPIDSPTVHEG